MLKYRVRSQFCIACLGVLMGIVIGFFSAYSYVKSAEEMGKWPYGGEISSETDAKSHNSESKGEAQSDVNVISTFTGVTATAVESSSLKDKDTVSSSTNTRTNVNKLWRSNNAFDSTMRSCLSNECYNSPVTYKDGVKRDRIGFLAPDLTGMDSLLMLLNKAANKDLVKEFNVVLDSHVPPYGYGKNHGWTRIVRFAHRVAPQAHALLTQESPSSSVNPSLYALQVRQLIRWHCRLSHVAAHTRMLTIFIDDLAVRPVVEIYKILSFVGHRAARADILEAMSVLYEQTMKDLHSTNQWQLSADGSSVLYDAVDLNDSLLIEAGVAAFANEMTTTDGLQKWPCHTFAHLDSSSAESAQLPLKSANLAANCSGAYVVCSVPVDKRGG